MKVIEVSNVVGLKPVIWIDKNGLATATILSKVPSLCGCFGRLDFNPNFNQLFLTTVTSNPVHLIHAKMVSPNQIEVSPVSNQPTASRLQVTGYT